jgi:mannonate dehydratase
MTTSRTTPIPIAEYFKPNLSPFWTTIRQIGVEHVISELDPHPDGYHDSTGDRPWDYVPLARIKERYEAAGLQLAGIEDWPPVDRARLGQPGREEEIENVCTLVRNMGRLGIPMLCYNWMARVNWTRTRTSIPARGGALVTGFRASDLANAPPIDAGSLSAEAIWDSLEHFLRQVVPVAEGAGVRLAIHPDDPPIPSLRGIPRIMISVEAFERVLAMFDSEANAICFCQGNFALMTDDLPGAIRRLGRDGRIAFGHFRDVRGTPDDFVETFHDDGPTDMLACMEAWHEIPFDGVLRPDHVPTLTGDSNDDPGYALTARLHAIGYMQGLREAAVRALALRGEARE